MLQSCFIVVIMENQGGHPFAVGPPSASLCNYQSRLLSHHVLQSPRVEAISMKIDISVMTNSRVHVQRQFLAGDISAPPSRSSFGILQLRNTEK